MIPKVGRYYIERDYPHRIIKILNVTKGNLPEQFGVKVKEVYRLEKRISNFGDKGVLIGLMTYKDSWESDWKYISKDKLAVEML